MGSGLLESVYEEALAFELQERGLEVARQVEVPIIYKGKKLKKGRDFSETKLQPQKRKYEYNI